MPIKYEQLPYLNSFYNFIVLQLKNCFESVNLFENHLIVAS